jgi:hypothetical protein
LGFGGTDWDTVVGTKLGQITTRLDRIDEASKYCRLRAKKNGLTGGWRRSDIGDRQYSGNDAQAL